MLYEIIFETTADDHQSRQLVRLLEALPLSVIDSNGIPEGATAIYPATPLVTFGAEPAAFRAPGRLGPRGWVAILPPDRGSVAAFVSAGAFRVLRLPLERSSLLSAISRCLSVGSATPAGASGRLSRLLPRRNTHVSA